MKKILTSILSIIVIFVILGGISFAQDSTTPPEQTTNSNSVEGRLEAIRTESGYQTADSYTLIDMIASIINTILIFLGLVFLLLIIISGFQWMMAGGNEDTIKKAKERIKNAVIGLAVITLSFSISYFVFSVLLIN